MAKEKTDKSPVPVAVEQPIDLQGKDAVWWAMQARRYKAETADVQRKHDELARQLREQQASHVEALAELRRVQARVVAELEGHYEALSQEHQAQRVAHAEAVEALKQEHGDSLEKQVTLAQARTRQEILEQFAAASVRDRLQDLKRKQEAEAEALAQKHLAEVAALGGASTAR